MIVLTLKAAIIIPKMIVEVRRDGKKSELHELTSAAVENGHIIAEDLNEQEFPWNNNRAENISAEDWNVRLLHREIIIQDDVRHYALKCDLVENIWANWGDS